MTKVVVYDFDKTLTYHDTLFAFFRHASEKNIFYPLKVLAYLFIMITTKLTLTTNTFLKQVGIYLFLKGLHRFTLQHKAKTFRDKIAFNTLYHNLEFTSNTRYYVVSASFYEYLRVLFPPSVNIIASQLSYHDDLVTGLAFNCYKENKLKNFDQKSIDRLYTDSLSDIALARLADVIYVVDADEITVCYSLEEFERCFV